MPAPGIDVSSREDDQFGFYAKAGYQFERGLFAEILYRDLDAKVKDTRLVGDRVDIKIPAEQKFRMEGWQLNVGYRF